MPFLALPTKSRATTRESHPPSSFVRSTAAVCVVAGISEVHKTQPSNAVRRQTVGHLLPLPGRARAWGLLGRDARAERGDRSPRRQGRCPNQYWGTRVCPLPGLPALECAQCHSPHGLKRSWAHLPEVLSGKPRTFLPRVLCRVRPAVRTARLRTFLRLSPLCDSLSPRPLPPAACTGAAKSTGQTLYIP